MFEMKVASQKSEHLLNLSPQNRGGPTIITETVQLSNLYFLFDSKWLQWKRPLNGLIIKLKTRDFTHPSSATASPWMKFTSSQNISNVRISI